jgi:hypothetical protein
MATQFLKNSGSMPQMVEASSNYIWQLLITAAYQTLIWWLFGPDGQLSDRTLFDAYPQVSLLGNSHDSFPFSNCTSTILDNAMRDHELKIPVSQFDLELWLVPSFSFLFLNLWSNV